MSKPNQEVSTPKPPDDRGTMTQNGRLVILCGLPGSGKTTLARQLEGVMPALRLSADDWMNELSINLHAEESRAKLEGL